MTRNENPAVKKITISAVCALCATLSCITPASAAAVEPSPSPAPPPAAFVPAIPPDSDSDPTWHGPYSTYGKCFAASLLASAMFNLEVPCIHYGKGYYYKSVV